MIVQSIIAAFSGFIQAYTIIKAKSAMDVSLFAWILSMISNIFWVIYGFMINDLVVTISSAIGFGACFTTVILWFIYPSSYSRIKQ